MRPTAEGSDIAAETSEKRPISPFCCTGLYHFARFALFDDVYRIAEPLSGEHLEADELYVALLYNTLVRSGHNIRFSVMPREYVIFCGVPAKYGALLAAPVY